MSSYWPASFEIENNGLVEIGLFSESSLYLLQYPLIARAPLEQYRLSGAFFDQKALVSVTDEQNYFQRYGYSTPNFMVYSNPGMYIQRIEHWRRHYEEHERDMLQFIRTGYGGYYLRAEQRVGFNAGIPTVHSDGFDLHANPGFSVSGTMGQNPFDVEHQETMSFPMFYFMSGDELIREAIDDYGESQLWSNDRGNFSMPGTIYFRAWNRRLRNFAWLYEFTGEQRYAVPVMAGMDYLIDERDDPNNVYKGGRNLNRGYFWNNTGDYDSVGFRQLHSFFGLQIFGEASHQALRIVRDNQADLGYQRIEDYEDALLGVAQFIYEEAAWNNNNFYWIPYDYNFDSANVVNSFDGSPYLGSRWAEHYYDMTGNNSHFPDAARVIWERNNYIFSNESSLHQNQGLMYADQYSRPPRYGWQEINVTVQDQGNGSYRLSWTVPAGATEYKIKYAGKQIVEWLGFNQITRNYQYDPATYTAYFAASNVSDEPQPQNVGTTQSYTIQGLQAGTNYFSVKYRQ